MDRQTGAWGEPKAPWFAPRKDLLIIGGILILAAVLWLVSVKLQPQGGYGDLYVDGKLTHTVSLGQDAVFSLETLPQVTFEVKDHTIAFVASDCPDHVCIKSGRLRHNGQFAACLPNRVTLWVRGDEAGQPDIVAG